MISKKAIETERNRFEEWLTDQDWCSVPLDVLVSLRNPEHVLTTDPINSGSDPYIFEDSDCQVAEDFLLAVGAMYAGWMAAVERRYKGV